MILYIVRHAIAAQSTAGVADEDRELTKEGIEKMKKAADGLRAIDAIPDIVLSSPLARARQTAEILIEAFDRKPTLSLSSALSPSANRPELYKEIRKYGAAGSIMLVGHQPSLGQIAGEIVYGSSGRPLDLKKGGACAIEIEKLAPDLCGTLLWLMTPAILRKLA
jgi:phosphohistidine phosphatase